MQTQLYHWLCEHRHSSANKLLGNSSSFITQPLQHLLAARQVPLFPLPSQAQSQTSTSLVGVNIFKTTTTTTTTTTSGCSFDVNFASYASSLTNSTQIFTLPSVALSHIRAFLCDG
ncbi:uncharacterized protein TEOVI_000625900 [Trypanosoma equiperdum]|uniref:Uncharacterized protein n=2 Tax=Trypanozoon TaxID=39700 RepID=Q38CX1_TRYB2|nr:hypothetical protein, unlikely [Trypanosoma brucei brucei TREU927]EAN77349.1 hypothetical protein, unlikely [Trypanosoma brucei brucei TREU927]SCU67033.1 hypothetical protein, conserved [Trypanosoma equiperdum]